MAISVLAVARDKRTLIAANHRYERKGFFRGLIWLMNLFEHLELFLGETAGGWKDPPGERWPFQVLEFLRGPIADAMILSTLGLSDFPLVSAVSGKEIRHELIFMVRASFGYRNIPPILHDVGKEAIDRGHAYLRGEVIGPRGKLFADTEMEALLLCYPVYLPDEFCTYRSPAGERRGIAWLVPITRQEAHFVATEGWQAFEDLLVKLNPDLLDMHRRSIVQ